MHPTTDPNEGSIEIVVCRYSSALGAPINPAPPRYANDTSSGAWTMGECKWVGGCVVVVWVRRTLSPLQPVAMLDPIPALPPPPPGALPPPFVDNVGPAPVAAPDGALAVPNVPQRDLSLQSSRLQHPAVHPGPPVTHVGQVPNLGLPAIAALPHYYHLPGYARPREPLPQQRNVTERGGVIPTVPNAAPAYPPPPAQSTPLPGVTIAGAGLLAGAEVRPFGGPLPPSPLDYVPPPPPQETSIMTAMGAVPPVPHNVTPARPIAPSAPQAQTANAAVSQRGATDPSGYSETVQTAPPRMTVPPTTAPSSPPDRALHPRIPVPPPTPAPPAAFESAEAE